MNVETERKIYTGMNITGIMLVYSLIFASYIFDTEYSKCDENIKIFTNLYRISIAVLSAPFLYIFIALYRNPSQIFMEKFRKKELPIYYIHVIQATIFSFYLIIWLVFFSFKNECLNDFFYEIYRNINLDSIILSILMLYSFGICFSALVLKYKSLGETSNETSNETFIKISEI